MANEREVSFHEDLSSGWAGSMDYATIRDLMKIDADKISKVVIADIN